MSAADLLKLVQRDGIAAGEKALRAAFGLNRKPFLNLQKKHKITQTA
jgi:hypothetical protein